MLTTLLISATLAQAAQNPGAQTTPIQAPALIVEANGFYVRALGKEHREPYELPTDAPDDKTTYRRDDAFAVWDARGLSIRHGTFTYHTRLPEVAVTPRLFTTAEIEETKVAIAKGDRKRDADRLIGSRRIGNEVYFWLAWLEKSGKTWLEVLTKVDLSHERPKPELVGRFDGFSLGLKPSESLMIGEQSIVTLTRRGPEWGVARFGLDSKLFTFDPKGQGLAEGMALSGRTLLLSEVTTYNKTRIVRFDIPTDSMRPVAEVAGKVSLVDGERPPLGLIQTNLGPALRNFETGVQMNLAADSVVRRTPAGVLVWPKGKPLDAAVYSPERFLRLARATKG